MNPSTSTATSSSAASTAAKVVLVSSVVLGCTYFAFDSRGNRVRVEAEDRSTKTLVAGGVRAKETERANAVEETEASQEEEQLIALKEVEVVREEEDKEEEDKEEEDKGATQVELKDAVGEEDKEGKADAQLKDTAANFTTQAAEEQKEEGKPNPAEETAKTIDNGKVTSPRRNSSYGGISKMESSETSSTKEGSSDDNSSQVSSGSERKQVSEKNSSTPRKMRRSSLKNMLKKLPKQASIRLSSRA